MTDPAPGPDTGTRGDRRRRAARARAYGAVRELVIVVGLALVLSLFVKTWLLQAFYIPSGSMEDTLDVGDRVVVNKLVPGAMPVDRGDIIVFEDPDGWLPPTMQVDRGPVLNALQHGLEFIGLLPSSSEDHLIKRVIGLPGDRVACCDADGRVTVNDTPLAEPYLKPGDAPSTLSFEVTVPEGRVWVMGDHRSNSEDSRFHDPKGDGTSGSVPIDRITGRAVLRVWPLDRIGWLSRAEGTFTPVAPRPTPTVTP